MEHRLTGDPQASTLGPMVHAETRRSQGEPRRAAAPEAPAAPVPHFCHVFPSFDHGGVPIRIAAVINHLGRRCRHTVVALDGCVNARTHVDNALALNYLPLTVDKSRPFRNLAWFRRTLARLRPDLLLTYNWGATEWALVNSLFPVCRHIHLESGFGAEEAHGQLRRRVLFRRLALRRAERIVVP